ncbi:MAG TPA: TetR/AcrR family transcriptional regulator [Actinomycetota bacterium]|nr:TetR/AcrR family transcriptional regulator [Actinomycetota bacterium]
MLKAPAQTTPRTPIQQQIVAAALTVLKTEGFAGASARAIARVGGFNQALVFYHFGTVHQLLLAALDETSRRRMERYRGAVEGAGSIEELVAVARDIYEEDLESGHVTVLSEMIAGSLGHPELGAAIYARVEPWIDFAEDVIKRVLAGTGFEQLLPSRDLAFAVVAFYLGMEQLSQLNGGTNRAAPLFEAATQVAGLLGPMFNTP